MYAGLAAEVVLVLTWISMNNCVVTRMGVISGVYEIRNVETGLRYVGSSVDVSNRWSTHRSLLRSNQHHSWKLQEAFNWYGEENFLFSVLTECPATEELLLAAEQRELDFHSDYNILKVAVNSAERKLSHETREVLSRAKRGKKMSPGLRKKLQEVVWEQRKVRIVSFNQNAEIIHRFDSLTAANKQGFHYPSILACLHGPGYEHNENSRSKRYKGLYWFVEGYDLQEIHKIIERPHGLLGKPKSKETIEKFKKFQRSRRLAATPADL